MNVVVETPKKLWSEAEVQALPEDGFIHEIVDGELVMVPRMIFSRRYLHAALGRASDFCPLRPFGRVSGF
jgi:hypothetical protein